MCNVMPFLVEICLFLFSFFFYFSFFKKYSGGQTVLSFVREDEVKNVPCTWTRK